EGGRDDADGGRIHRRRHAKVARWNAQTTGLVLERPAQAWPQDAPGKELDISSDRVARAGPRHRVLRPNRKWSAASWHDVGEEEKAPEPLAVGDQIAGQIRFGTEFVERQGREARFKGVFQITSLDVRAFLAGKGAGKSPDRLSRGGELDHRMGILCM